MKKQVKENWQKQSIKRGMIQLSTIIQEVRARKVLNIRGEETIEVEVTTHEGFGRASAPAGVVESARIAKINELIRIEEIIGKRAKMANLAL
jgi:enolase